MNTFSSYSKYASIRDSLGLKDSQVADAVGLSRTTFSDWKHNKSMPKLDKLNRIASYLNVSLSNFTDISDAQDTPCYKDELLELILQLNGEQRELIIKLIKNLSRTK